MSDSIISVEGLIKKYGAVSAVNGISFSVKQGEIYGLLGPNGAGKTTTLECLEGLRRIDGGNITVAGCNPRKDKKEIRNKVGVQLQSSSFPDGMLVSEAMALVCAWHQTEYRSDLLECFGIEGMIKKKYHQLSTGQQRRLHLALALVSNPSVVVLDEPTAGLDVEGRAQLHNEIRKLKKQNVTMLLATHDMAEAEELCDQISIVIKGKVAVTGTPFDVTAASKRDSRIAIRTDRNSLSSKCKIEGATFFGEKDRYSIWACSDSALAIGALMQRVKEANDSVIDLRVERPSLEESFLELVSGGEIK
ncbi:ABC transporter ATP-binding protein [Clostridium boliviensis]|uniref:ABC transporter ATP-binding protein n=1 Tax=Clostridium boliviensis TaxID=318465 RepID=A0ABU4GSG2_9CLOT|nr:ABC transporter ATP-binding protein [Clostridium boliviensis]MDW2799935.1 ABC transporter ATP-binding protein [Clostridium boliviensis]